MRLHPKVVVPLSVAPYYSVQSQSSQKDLILSRAIAQFRIQAEIYFHFGETEERIFWLTVVGAIVCFQAKAQELAQRIRGYWRVKNKVYYITNVPHGEDKSRILITLDSRLRAVAIALSSQLLQGWRSLPVHANTGGHKSETGISNPGRSSGIAIASLLPNTTGYWLSP